MSQHLIRSWEYSWSARGLSPRTMDNMRPYVTAFLQARGDALMTSTSPATTRLDCEQFISDQGTPFTRNYAWRSLRSFFGWMAEEEYVTTNPMGKVKAPAVPLTETTVASDEDFLRLLKTCSPWRTMTTARDASIISLLWATGLRRGELAALRLDDVDLDSMTLIVRASKNGTSRRVPFDARTTQHLVRYLARRERSVHSASPMLWLGKCGPLMSDGIRLMLQRRAREAGVQISAHSFRRGFAARAIRAGVSQGSLMTIAGWKNPTMPLRYTRSVAVALAEDEYRLKMSS